MKALKNPIVQHLIAAVVILGVVFGLRIHDSHTTASRGTAMLGAVGPTNSIFDPRTFGAVGNGSHDDTAAIVAANAAAQSANGSVVFYPPPSGGAYMINSPIVVQWPAKWSCDTTANLADCPIRAGTAMDHMVELQSAFPGGGVQPEFGSASRATWSHLTFDGNGLVNHNILLNFTFYSRFTQIAAYNSLVSGIRAVNTQSPLGISSVTVINPGGSPSGVTVAQADAHFSDLFLSPSANVVIQIASTAARDSSTYFLSTDGGVSFSTMALPLAANVNLAAATTGNSIPTIIGITASFPSGTYHTGDTYTFSLTWTTGLYGDTGSSNSDLEIGSSQFYSNGSVFWSSGFNGQFAGGYRGSLESGTAATSSGSPIITFSGAPDLAQLLATGYSRVAIKLNASTPVTYIGWVIDSSHVAVVHGLEPTTTASGLDWAFSVGAGYYEDGLNEGGWNHIHDVNFGNDSVCASVANGNGPFFEYPNLISCGVTGISVGGSISDNAAGTMISHSHGNSGSSVSGSTPFLLSPWSTGSIIEPQTNSGISGLGANGWILQSKGQFSPISASGASSWVPNRNLQVTPTVTTIPSATTQIAAPPSTYTGASSSYVRFSMAGSFNMSSAPVIASAPGGTILFLENDDESGHIMTLIDNVFSGSGISLPGESEYIAPCEVAILISQEGINIPNWAWVTKKQAYTNGCGLGGAGNTGDGYNSIVTTNATPTHIYQLAVQAGSAIAPNGTTVSVDVSASNGSATGFWQNYIAAWTNTGTRTNLVTGASGGSGSGNVPANSWAITFDGTVVGSAFISVTGDASGTPVTWTIRVRHMDPG